MYTASHLTYLLLCPRKLWLHERQFRLEDESADVAIGLHLDRHSYRRRAGRWRQLDLGALKIDHYDPVNRVVREVKKSAKLEHVHIAQLKYYLYYLEQRGVRAVSGLLEYPRQRRTTEVVLTDTDRSATIPAWEAEITRIARGDCPPVVRKPICQNCAFHDFCYS